jgi:hypothetical protein
MAVRSETAGMPGVSGELNVQGVPTPPGRANDPGVVPSHVLDGLFPMGGSEYDRAESIEVFIEHLMKKLCSRSSQREMIPEEMPCRRFPTQFRGAIAAAAD